MIPFTTENLKFWNETEKSLKNKSQCKGIYNRI